MMINKNDNKYISQLSDEELKEMMLSYLYEMIDQYKSDRSCLKEENIIFRIYKGKPNIFDSNNINRGFWSEVTDYYAKVRVFGLHLDVSNMHRKNMYKRFGTEYLEDLENMLMAPVLTRLDNIKKLLEELKSEGEITPDVLPEEMQ